MIENYKVRKFTAFVKKARTAALICHMNPDGDTVFSALALAAAMKKLDKKADVYCDDDVPEKLRFLPYTDEVNSGKDKKYDLAIAVDCSDADRFAVCAKYYEKASAKIVVDHHKTNDKFADYTLCDPTAAATAEVVYAVIKSLEEELDVRLFDDKIALLLFSALVTDSGCFSYSNTSSDTFYIASQLKKYNIDSYKSVYNLTKKTTVEAFRLKHEVLNKTAFYDDNKIAVMTFFQTDFLSTDTSQEDTEGIISELVNIDDVLVAISIAEIYDKYFKVSIRTKENYDASEIAVAFGGGGHSRAAGCRLSGYYEDIVEKLLKASRDIL